MQPSIPQPTSPKVAAAMVPLNKDTLNAKIYDQLRSLLISGLLRPGETITLRQLAASFRTSIMPVRDAVGRLVAEGALVCEKRCFFVPAMDRFRFSELTEIRCSLEMILASRACSLMTRDRADKLQIVHNRMADAIRRGDALEACRWNRIFHFQIYRSAASDVMGQMAQTVWMQVGPFLNASAKDGTHRWTVDHHEAFLDALKARNPDRAARAMGTDIEHAAADLLAAAVFDAG